MCATVGHRVLVGLPSAGNAASVSWHWDPGGANAGGSASSGCLLVPCHKDVLLEPQALAQGAAAAATISSCFTKSGWRPRGGAGRAREPVHRPCRLGKAGLVPATVESKCGREAVPAGWLAGQGPQNLCRENWGCRACFLAQWFLPWPGLLGHRVPD